MLPTPGSLSLGRLEPAGHRSSEVCQPVFSPESPFLTLNEVTGLREVLRRLMMSGVLIAAKAGMAYAVERDVWVEDSSLAFGMTAWSVRSDDFAF